MAKVKMRVSKTTEYGLDSKPKGAYLRWEASAANSTGYGGSPEEALNDLAESLLESDESWIE